MLLFTRFGDKSATCLAYSTDDCVDPAKAAECCQLCGPEAPTTMETTSMSSSSTTESPVSVCFDIIITKSHHLCKSRGL